jgi:hypothetical protein
MFQLDRPTKPLQVDEVMASDLRLQLHALQQQVEARNMRSFRRLGRILNCNWRNVRPNCMKTAAACAR